MHLAMTLIIVFLLAGYSFAFGYEVGSRVKTRSITPRSITNPGFRVVYRNPELKKPQ